MMFSAETTLPPLEPAEHELSVVDTGPVNILVVDDIPEKILSYEAILEELEQNVLTATSGENALKLVLQQEFAVILLDVNMPGMDGFELAHYIRKRKKSAHTPIIFLTAFTDEVRMAQGYASGAVDYLPTPVVPEILKAKVQVFIELAQMRRQAAMQAKEHAMRISAEEAAKRSELLMNSTDMFARARNPEDIISALAGLPLPYLADISLIWLDDGKAPVRVRAHLDSIGQRHEEKVDSALRFPQLEKPMQKALDSGQTQRLGMMPVSAMLPLSESDEVVSFHDTGKADIVILPFTVRDTVKGALVMARRDIRQNYTLNKISLGSDLASKAARAWENIILLDKIHEADRRKDEFLAMLAHELRNPLAPIQNALFVMKNTEDPDIRAQAEGTIERQLKHMVHLVDDLMDVSRITQGKIELRKEPIRLNDALTHAIETAQPLIRQRGHRLNMRITEEPVWLNADFSRISQIFSNLLNNAAKYTNEEGSIHVAAEVAGNTARITIADNGIGIPQDMISRIFDIFLQVDTSLERSQGGLGIGLSLARSLVEMHGGSIEATSGGEQQGSTFLVTLPVVNSPQESTTAVDEAVQVQETPLKVLVVDDNEASARTLGWMLEIFACETTLSHSGEHAIATARALQPDIIMLDIGLPGMNGYEICQVLKEDSRFKDTTFIAQTGWGQREHRKKSESIGFDYHLVKPVDINQLRNIINETRIKAAHMQPTM